MMLLVFCCVFVFGLSFVFLLLPVFEFSCVLIVRFIRLNVCCRFGGRCRVLMPFCVFCRCLFVFAFCVLLLEHRVCVSICFVFLLLVIACVCFVACVCDYVCCFFICS